MKEILSEYKDTLDKALESNDESVRSYYSSADLIIESLNEELKKKNLSFDQKKYIIDKMVEVQKMKGEKDSENKKFIVAIAGCGLFAVGVSTMALQVALGGNTKIEHDDSNN